MINDLQTIAESQIIVTTQVCIIGAGTAGIFLAQELSRLGIDSVILELGDKKVSLPSDIGERCLQLGIPYKGEEKGRVFGLGGTSTLWGGQMISLSPSDFKERYNSLLPAWPISYSELSQYFADVKKRLDLDTVNDENRLTQKYFQNLSDFSDDFNLRISDWIPFKNRNFSQAFSDFLRNNGKVKIWLNSVVTKLEIGYDSDQKEIIFAEAKSSNGKTIKVSSKYFVVCAGALESTRLILSLDESSQGMITAKGSPVGRYFSDHLSITGGKIQCLNWRRYNAHLSPIFYRGLMRSPRLELSESAQKKYDLSSAFIHFTFVTRGNTGFDMIRNFLRKRQGEQISSSFSSTSLNQIIGDTFSLFLWRSIYQRLWIPRQADLFLQIDIEQVPNWDSRLILSDQVDDYARKRLVIDWKISSNDIRTFKTLSDVAQKSWNSSSLKNYATLDLDVNPNFDDPEASYDVYHPTGSLRMGTTPSESVVDSNLKLWNLKNCFISSTAVFPTAGSANPGFTHLALTMRLAQHLNKLLTYD